MSTKALHYSFGRRCFHWLKLVTSVFALGKMPKPPLSRFYYTVWTIYRLIFNDFLLMFNEEIQSALCKFHPLFHYRNISYVNVGSERKAAVWILIVRLACSTLCFPLSIHPSCLCYRKVNRFYLAAPAAPLPSVNKTALPRGLVTAFSSSYRTWCIISLTWDIMQWSHFPYRRLFPW